MKMLPIELNNTERELLAMLQCVSGVNVHFLVAAKYKRSGQAHKKAVTLTKHLRRLERRGLVRSVGAVWIAKEGR